MLTPNWFLKRNIISFVLWPVSMLYFLAHKIVYFFRSFSKKTSKIPVICVGGLLAGGVGKTPIVREIANRLSAPVIMRGYKGAGGKRSFLVKQNTDVKISGDEAKMLSNAKIPVYVGNRKDSITRINAENRGVPAIVMDDGFQNPTIKKDISILVFDGKLGVGNGFVLPAGPLREPLCSGIEKCDAVIIIGDKAAKNNQYAFARDIKKPVFFAKKQQLAGGVRGRVIAFAGIGYPDKFFDAVSKIDRINVIERIPFPDHHFYSAGDFRRLFKLSKKYNAHLITTEKDWVKIPAYLQKKIRYLPLEMTIEDAFWNWVYTELNKYENI